MKRTTLTAVLTIAVFSLLIISCASSRSSAVSSQSPKITYSLAIQMAEQKMIRYNSRGTFAIFGSLGGQNEDLSAANAQKLIDQCKEWYAKDPDYRKIVDIVEREVVTKLQYDWDSYFKRTSRSYQESLNAGVGVCDVYAQRVMEILTETGYKVEKWAGGNHAWNHVIMPDGRILYIDATWYDNCYDNRPTIHSPDSYAPWYVTYDKKVFEHGFNGTINMHGAWPDAVKRN
jgi:hypothetical protein